MTSPELPEPRNKRDGDWTPEGEAYRKQCADYTKAKGTAREVLQTGEWANEPRKPTPAERGALSLYADGYAKGYAAGVLAEQLKPRTRPPELCRPSLALGIGIGFGLAAVLALLGVL